MQSNKRVVRVTKHRDVRVHGELWHTSGVLLKHGQQHVEGCVHQFRASLVFTAFALEAYFNWLGRQRVPNWRYLERLSPREKAEIVAAQFGVTVDFTTKPWSIITELFGFRNKVVHGKPERLQTDAVEPLDGYLDQKLGVFLRTQWEDFCTEANAVRARNDVLAVAEQLHAAAAFGEGESTDPFFTGFQAHGVSL